MLKNKEKICGLAAGLAVAMTFAAGCGVLDMPRAEAISGIEVLSVPFM